MNIGDEVLYGFAAELEPIEAEEAVLGSVLLDREVIGRVSGSLEARDFYRERTRKAEHGGLRRTVGRAVRACGQPEER